MVPVLPATVTVVAVPLQIGEAVDVAVPPTDNAFTVTATAVLRALSHPLTV